MKSHRPFLKAVVNELSSCSLSVKDFDSKRSLLVDRLRNANCVPFAEHRFEYDSASGVIKNDEPEHLQLCDFRAL